MPNRYTAITTRARNWRIGRTAEIPGINCQERSCEELFKSLKIVLKEALKFNRQEALKATETNFAEERLCLLNAIIY